MPDADASVTSGVEPRGYRRGPNSTDGWDQYVVPVEDRIVTFKGRSSTFRITGRAATTQNLLSIFNADSTTKVCVNRVMIDTYSTSVKAVTVPAAIARVSRISANPTTGFVQTKTGLDTALSSNANVTVRGDAQADNTNATTALAVTLTGTPLTQEAVPRLLQATAVGWGVEIADRMEFFAGSSDVILNANEGLALHLNAAAATAIAAGDFFVATIDWTEYTRP